MTNAQIQHVEPPFWWTDMHMRNLQVLFYGKDIADYNVQVSEGIEILQVKKTENPNYLFVTIKSDMVKVGTHSFRFEKEGKKPFFKEYIFKERRVNSAERKGFDSSDMIYLLMPDRFANGNPAHDSDPILTEKANRKQPGGRHGGDIKGIIDHLDYLEELGVTALWSTPLNEDNDKGYSYHGYAQSDVYNVDPRYGTNEEYRELAAALHKRDMKLIMDYVTNHWGSEHWMIKDLPTYDWIHQFPGYANTNYRMTTQFDPHTSAIDKKFNENGWFVESMPDLNQSNPLVLNYLTQNAIWWIEYANLDGLRSDTYSYNEKEGIAKWTKAIMDEYPNLNIMGEVWMHEPAQIAYWQKDSKIGAIQNFNSHLPTVMDFPLHDVMERLFAERQDWDTGMVRAYNVIANDFLYPDINNLLVFIENHDTQRVNTKLKGSLADYKLATTLIATTRGIPQLYYGSEIGMKGDKDKGDGDIRRDFPGGWEGDKNNAFSQSGRSEVQEGYHAFTKKLFNWRKGAKAVHSGHLLHYVPQEKVYVYFRILDDKRIMVVLNNNSEDQVIKLDRFAEGLNKKTSGADILTGNEIDLKSELKVTGKTPMVIEMDSFPCTKPVRSTRIIHHVMKIKVTILIFFATLSCKNAPKTEKPMQKTAQKEVIYQVFTRLFGNTNATNKPWGTLAENGVGKFSAFTPKALQEIKDLGVTYIWYTGVPHHAVITDYTQYGISNDDADVVKGRAGSPYAVKDYYQVDPDLAEDPAKRMEEFEALIKRTHDAGLKLIIDVVPNHVARKYEGKNNPGGVTDFGAEDDTDSVYAKNNSFYYIPGNDFKVPDWQNGYVPLGGTSDSLVDGKFDESPAKWTGNGARDAQPDQNDWYETVKVNYGTKPDGSADFDALPADFETKDYNAHFDFWKDKEVPASWNKFRDIALFWTEKDVDGFRYDMAEMVPVEFWSYMNSAIKMKNPDAFLLAEVYNPAMYRDYIHKGKMDYLYDKVALYDTLKNIMQGHGSTDHLAPIIEGQADIENHLLHFLENHDEQRIASPDFAGDAEKGKPAMVVSATITSSPTMVYFGQEFGEPAEEDLGFGDPTRTSIFDYGSVPSVRKWVNKGAFDGEKNSEEELELRDFYKKLLNFTLKSTALMGEYADLQAYNQANTKWYNDKIHSFVRWSDDEKLIIVTNFDAIDSFGFELQLPQEIIEKWGFSDGNHSVEDQLYHKETGNLEISGRKGQLRVDVKPLESFIFKVEK